MLARAPHLYGKRRSDLFLLGFYDRVLLLVLLLIIFWVL